MTEFASTPSAIEEANTQRSRTADWIQRFAVPGLPPTPSTSTDSEWEKRSLWDGNGWDPPSDCESSTSVPPTMMLQYPDSRQVLITPTTQGEEGSPRRRGHRTGHAHGHGHNHVDTHGPGEGRDEARTERARSRGSRSGDHNPNPTSTSASKSIHPTGGVPSQTSSMRLARAAAAPLPDSRSSSSAGVSGSRVRSSARGRDAAEAEAINSASHIATSSHSHPSHILSSRAERVYERAPSNQPSHPPPSQQHLSHPPSHAPSHRPSHPPSQHPSQALSHIPSQVPSHQPSRHPSHSPSHPPSHPASQNVPSHVPSQRPSQAASREASHVPSHHSQPPHLQSSHPPSAFSNHTATPAPAHPPTITPSANGTIVANGANGVGAPSPPSIHSIQSRSISVTESRSSGPPEPIVIHPPSNPPSRSHRTTSVTNGVNSANVQLPPASAASASLGYYSVQPRQSHLDDQQQEQHPQQGQDGQSVAPSHRTSHSHSYQNQNQNGQAAHSPNGQLPTPVSPIGHASYVPPPGSTQPPGPMHAPSTTSATGLGGGYVLVDVPSPGHEKEFEDELAKTKGKGSTGNKSTRERGSLFNVFGKHNRSKSLPMQGMMGGQEQEREMHQGLSSAYHPQVYTQQQNPNVHNPYLTPISPLSPISPYSPHYAQPPAPGVTPVQPHQHSPPPKIVYAPARHHSATHFSPPRIMYVPASPRRGQRLAPYDTNQILHPNWGQGQGQAYAYPYGQPYPSYQQHAPMRPGQKAGHAGMAVGMEHARENSPGSVRRSQTLQETVRDSGWEEGKKERDRDISAARESGGGDHGANAGDIIIARDFAQTPVAGAGPPENDAATVHANGDANAGPSPASPSGSHAPVDRAHADAAAAPASVMSDRTRSSQRSNMAGVGTVSARSRSRGRGAAGTGPQPSPVSPSHGLEAEIERGRSRERSRSRARGMVYSTSAPQPQTQTQVAPHAAMMIPPASAVRDRGVRDTPYPSPPGSVSEQLYHQRQQQMQMQNGFPHQGHVQGRANGIIANGHGPAHKSTLAPTYPATHEASQSPSGFVSRIRDIYHSSHSPTSPRVAERDSPSSSPNRGRTRERNRDKDISRKALHANGNGRAKSVDSQVSSSSASTYYVISTPGQKVRLIRTNGQAVTATTSDYRASSGSRGWLKKALRAPFFRRDHAHQQQEQEHSPSSQRKADRDRDYDQHEPPSTPTQAQAPALASSRPPSGGSGTGSTKSRKKGGRKLLRRNTTGSAALLSASREASQGNPVDDAARLDADDRDVDIVIPGQ